MNIYGFGMPPKTTHYRGKDYNTFVGDSDEYAYHHFAYVRTPQRMLEKLVSQYIQNEEPLRDSEYNHCQNFRDPHPWFINEDVDDLALVHPSELPSRMLNNAWSQMVWSGNPERLSYDEARNLLGWQPPIQVREAGI
jgi:hypothetical protein